MDTTSRTQNVTRTGRSMRPELTAARAVSGSASIARVSATTSTTVTSAAPRAATTPSVPTTDITAATAQQLPHHPVRTAERTRGRGNAKRTPRSPHVSPHRVRGSRKGIIRRPRLDDRGSAVEAAILFPFLIILTFAIVQGGIWFYARSTALNAAEEALQAARTEDGSTGAAVSAANDFLTRTGTDVVKNPSTRIDASPTTITVTITADSLKIVDFLPLPAFTQTVTGARERFTTTD